MAYWCLVMMIKAGKNVREKNYSKVVKIILGKKLGILIDITIAIFLFWSIDFLPSNYLSNYWCSCL